jgi:hypothetical protein
MLTARPRLPLRLALAGVALLLVVPPRARAAAEEVDNPRYANWAKFAVGSSATYAGEVAAAGFKGTMESVYKLAEKTDDHVVVEITSTMTMAGNKQALPAQKVTIKSKTPKADVKELGKEDVEAAGKKYPCTIYELSGLMPQAKDAKLKAWVNDDIPGGIVKMEMKNGENVIASTLKSFESK